MLAARGQGGSATAASSGPCAVTEAVPAVDVVLMRAYQHVPVLCPAVESLFQALCDASALNPDSDMEEETGAQLFFDEAEVSS